MKHTTRPRVLSPAKKAARMLNKWGPEWAIRLAMVVVRFPHETKEGWWRKMTDLYGVHRQTSVYWMQKEPLFRQAVDMALELLKHKVDERENFGEFVLGRMSKESRELYEQLVFWEDHPDGAEKTRGIMMNMSDRERRIMFVQCMAANGFSYSKALRLMGVSGDTVKNWTKHRGFRAMLNEVQQLKKDFFEQALVDVVAARDTQAIIFANKTLNRDRGYGEKLDVKMEGTVNHTHTVVPLAALEGLPTETLDLILRAVQEHKRKQMEAQAAGPSALTLPSGEEDSEGVLLDAEPVDAARDDTARQ